MLKKRYRLPIQEMIKKNGKTIRGPFFLIKIFQSQFPYSRFGIIISKKATKDAVKRNKLKRLIFSILNPVEKMEKDFLIIVSPAINKLEKKEIIEQIKSAFKKL